ncbi:MAG: type I-E CRISPR-associated protein Cse1/CasA, partial [Planctomycetes bacterium]|nr:type I-E CRISPR-associated protein Cse1/CasA [Planctomycetota bacterium]
MASGRVNFEMSPVIFLMLNIQRKRVSISAKKEAGMTHNLIHQKWIPVKRKNGEHEKIAPWQLTEDWNSNPVAALDAPRPDFNGSLIQFLIGLGQTVLAPKDIDRWFDLLSSPPKPEELKKDFTSVDFAFNVDGDGRCFMQEHDLEAKDPKNISLLLIDSPAGNTLKENKDHFIKRGGCSELCYACAATALFTLQTNAPSGGVGHRTSLRGGGPLTTLLCSETLWETVWLNILDRSSFETEFNSKADNEPANAFPWLLPKRTSEPKTGCDTTPEDVHPLQMYWGMPRRVKLEFNDTSRGTCALCGEDKVPLVSQYITKNYGTNFTGAWKHPLSPHGKDDKGFPLPRHPQPGGITFRHWLGLVQPDRDSKNRVEPAFVVHRYSVGLARDIPDFRLWAFGYDMDNMKARCWYESTMPIIRVEKRLQTQYAEIVHGYIKAADIIGRNLRMSLKKAWFSNPRDAKGDTSYIETAFWQDNEGTFYNSINDLKFVLQKNRSTQEIAKRWHDVLLKEALKLFDEYAVT